MGVISSDRLRGRVAVVAGASRRAGIGFAITQLHDDSKRSGRIILFTSGPHLGPMAGELPYAISKGAINAEGGFRR